jgi:hypothetical protein
MVVLPKLLEDRVDSTALLPMSCSHLKFTTLMLLPHASLLCRLLFLAVDLLQFTGPPFLFHHLLYGLLRAQELGRQGGATRLLLVPAERMLAENHREVVTERRLNSTNNNCQPLRIRMADPRFLCPKRRRSFIHSSPSASLAASLSSFGPRR